MTDVLLFTPVFSSRLAPVFARYVDLKRALGRRFDIPARTLQDMDRFLHDHKAKYPDLDSTVFHAWCHTHEHVASGVRRSRMLEVRAFCLYRRRSEPQCFVPDSSFFPPYHQRLKPYIFSAAEVGKLLSAAAHLKRNPASPLRPELTRLAIVLLFTTGMRRGELHVTVRAAIAGYVLQLWNVDCSPDRSLDPTIHWLCLKNLNTIKGSRSLEIAPGFADVRLGGSPIHS